MATTRKSASKTAAKKTPAKKTPAKKTPIKNAPAKKSAQRMSGKDEVDLLMSKLDHPLKAEVEAVRAIILNANSKIAERVKWNSPSFFHVIDMAAFNLRRKDYVHLIVVFPKGAPIADSSGLLEGNHTDRREAKFYTMKDIEQKKPVLEKVVNDWMKLVDR